MKFFKFSNGYCRIDHANTAVVMPLFSQLPERMQVQAVIGAIDAGLNQNATIDTKHSVQLKVVLKGSFWWCVSAIKSERVVRAVGKDVGVGVTASGRDSHLRRPNRCTSCLTEGDLGTHIGYSK